MGNCKVCGSIISTRRVYCSDSCKEKNRYNTTLYKKKCEVCGEEFVGKKGMSKCSAECALISERKYKKTCPVCKSEFSSRGNGIYCSEVCYRTANSSTKGLMITSCEVCGDNFRTPKTSPELVCSDICSAKLFTTFIKKSHKKVFGTEDSKKVKKIIEERRKACEEETI